MNNSKQFLDELKKQISELEPGLGIEETVKQAARIFGNPIFLIDVCYNLLTYSMEFPTDDFLCNELVAHQGFSHETVSFFNDEKFISSFDNADIVVLMKSDKLKYNRMNGKLFDKDTVQLGDAVIVECYRPFVENEDEVFEMLCEKLSVELQNSKFREKITRVFGDSLLSDVLEYNQPFSTVFKEGLTEILGEMKKNVFVAAADISQFDGTLTHLGYFRQKFEEIQPEFKYFIGLQSIIIFLSSDKDTLNIDEDFKELNKFFEKNRIFTGISSVIKDLDNIQIYYREAIRALNSGLENKQDGNIFILKDRQ